MPYSKQYLPDEGTIYQMLPVYTTWGHAVLEMIDNSGEYRHDKEAGNIAIHLKEMDNGKMQLILADDGKGVEELGKMFAFDRNASTRSSGCTGKFGFGFKGATSFLVGRKLNDVQDHQKAVVYTKVNGKMTLGFPQSNNYRFLIFSQDELSEKNQLTRWTNHWGEYSPNPNSDSGTVVQIDTCHTYDEKEINKFVDLIALTYHDKFKDRINVTVNGNPVEYKDIRGLPLSKSSLPNFDDFTEQFTYINGSDVKVSAFMHEAGSGTHNSGFCISRNGRIVLRGGKLGFSKVLGAQSVMRGFQIFIEVDETADDLFLLEANKLIKPDQTIDRGFKKALENCGLKNLINKVHDSGRKSKVQKEDLSFWQGSLQAMAKSFRNTAGEIHHDEIVLKRTKSSAKHTNDAKKRAKKNKTGITNPMGYETNMGLESFNGAIKFRLDPLCEDGEEYTYELSKGKKGDSKLDITFNSDVDFIRMLLLEKETNKSGTYRPTKPAVAYVRKTVAEILALTDGTLSVEEAADWRRISQKLGKYRPQMNSGGAKERVNRSGSLLEDHTKENNDTVFDNEQAVMLFEAK